MSRNIQSPTKSLSSPSWTSFVTSNNSGFNVIPTANNNGSTLNASIISMSGTQQSPLQQQPFTATIHTTGTAQNQINSNRYTRTDKTFSLAHSLNVGKQKNNFARAAKMCARANSNKTFLFVFALNNFLCLSYRRFFISFFLAQI